ncbi:MAG: hypothetical protein QG597_3128 [Actinomycetota bacterium]|nr:hypothetical protein [Actinomycetota bacterium]
MCHSMDAKALEILEATVRAWAPSVVAGIPPDTAAELAAAVLAAPADPHGLPAPGASWPGSGGSCEVDPTVLDAVQAMGRPLRDRLLADLAPLTAELKEIPVLSLASLLPEPPSMFGMLLANDVGVVLEAVTFLEAMQPGALAILRRLVEAVAPRVRAEFVAAFSETVAPPGPGAPRPGERSILAAHGVAHLGPALAVVAAVLGDVLSDVDTPDRSEAATIGSAAGLTALALRAGPEPSGYRAAVLARERAEYVRPTELLIGEVQVSEHRFALAEGAFPDGEIDVSATGLAAAIPGGVVVRTGTADGRVSVKVRFEDQEPTDEVSLTGEVVDLSYHAEQGFASVLGVGDTAAEGLRHVTPPQAGDYRVRVRANGRDGGGRLHRESYWLTVWPAPLAPAVVHRRTDILGYRLRGKPEPVRPDRPELSDFEEASVSYHQLTVSSDWNDVNLGLHAVGGGLVHIQGPVEITVMTGPHTGTVNVHALALQTAPRDGHDGWDAVEQATLWAPSGHPKARSPWAG